MMSVSGAFIIIVIVGVLLAIGIPVGIFFAIRSFIRYHAELNRKKSPQQEELDRMKIDDL